MTTFQTSQCYTETWSKREMTAEEIKTAEGMVSGYENATITSVHFCEKGVTVNLAVNIHSKAKYPNNHREYQEFRSSEKQEWKGWF